MSGLSAGRAGTWQAAGGSGAPRTACSTLPEEPRVRLQRTLPASQQQQQSAFIFVPQPQQVLAAGAAAAGR